MLKTAGVFPGPVWRIGRSGRRLGKRWGLARVALSGVWSAGRARWECFRGWVRTLCGLEKGFPLSGGREFASIKGGCDCVCDCMEGLRMGGRDVCHEARARHALWFGVLKLVSPGLYINRSAGFVSCNHHHPEIYWYLSLYVYTNILTAIRYGNLQCISWKVEYY